MKHLLWAMVPILMMGCRREMLSDDNTITQARAVINMNALAGTPFSYPVQVSIVSTPAGGLPGYQDGPGGQATFRMPTDVATDASGNVYIADAVNNRIRKMNANGIVTTVAGNGQYGWSDGAALSAQFRNPTGVAVDAVGNIYVADRDNNRVRKVGTDGMVSTVAGGDIAGFADGPGNMAKFNAPADVAVDATGTLYVADYGNNRIRRISATGVVTQWCGSTPGYADASGVNAKFDGPVSVAVSSNGVVYVADSRNNRIRKITSGAVTTLAGSDPGFADGTGSAAKFSLPSGVATDAGGNVYVSDDLNSRIRKVTSAGVVTTLAGSTASFNDGYDGYAQFHDPGGLVVDVNGFIYIADMTNNRIRKMTSIPAVRTLTANRIKGLNGLGIDGAGNLYAGADSGRIMKVTPDGNVTLLAGSTLGYADGAGTAARFGHIGALTADAAGNVYVPDYNNNRIRKITSTGVVTTMAGNGSSQDVDGTGTAAGISSPMAVTLDPAGNMYVVESGGTVRKITPTGVVTTLSTIPVLYGGPPDHQFSNPPYPTDIKYAPNELLISSWHQRVIWYVSPDAPGNAVQLTAGDGAGHSVAFGEGGAVYIGFDGYIMKRYVLQGGVTPGDIYVGSTSVVGYIDGPMDQALFYGATQMVCNPVTHVLYVADIYNERIRMLSE